LGVIGGTGFYTLQDFTYVAELNPETPWGYPSSPITIARSPEGTPVAFIARHGRGHIFSPSEVPSRANIAALKHIGIKAIIAFSAVGSLQHDVRPRDFLLPNQIIDRTRGIRPGTFFEKGLVGHAMFADPFDAELEKIISKAGNALQGGSKLHSKATMGDKDVTVVCMEGPCFSTRAESHMYRSFGGAVINMSALPESKLAREAEIAYQMVCMITDYDCWKDDGEPVTVEIVNGHLKANADNASSFLTAVVASLEDTVKAGELGKWLEGSMKYSIATARDKWDPEVAKKIAYILPHVVGPVI